MKGMTRGCEGNRVLVILDTSLLLLVQRGPVERGRDSACSGLYATTTSDTAPSSRMYRNLIV